MKRIMQSILASAQTLYPTTVCHFVIMANHMHLLLVVQDPEDFVSFIGYLKRESAHAVNRLLGRKKHTVWCDRYDDPKILDPEKAIQRIVYLYTNPQKANLVETIDQYPNLSTWQAFLSGGTESFVGRIPRNAITELPERALSPSQQQRFTAELEDFSAEEQTLLIEPDAWMKCFSDLEGQDPEAINTRIVQEIREQETQLQKTRATQNIPVIGARRLENGDMRKSYMPKKRGKRMICLSSVIAYRKRFINFYKEYTGYKTQDESKAMVRRSRTLSRVHNLLASRRRLLFIPSAGNYSAVLPIREISSIRPKSA